MLPKVPGEKRVRRNVSDDRASSRQEFPGLARRGCFNQFRVGRFKGQRKKEQIGLALNGRHLRGFPWRMKDNGTRDSLSLQGGDRLASVNVQLNVLTT